jgi:hypothetical protein
LVALVGCSADASSAPSADASQGAQDQAEGALTLDVRAEERVAGAFVSEAVELRFDFVVRGASRTAKLSTATGDELIESTIDGAGVETMNVLGGRAVVRGLTTSIDPRIEGDREAIVELNRRSEMKLVEPLREALKGEGVPAELYRGVTEGGGVRPQGVMGQQYYLGCGQSEQFPTWAFWKATYVRIVNRDPRIATVEIRNPYTWDVETVYASPYPQIGHALHLYRHYWGFPMRITNLCLAGPTTVALDLM